MGTQFIEGSFRRQIIPGESGDQIPLNVADGTPVPATGWTVGGTIIDNLDIQAAPLGQVWSFLGWSITFSPFIQVPAGGTAAITQLGNIVGGLTFLNATPTIFGDVVDGVPYQQPYTVPMIPLPTNTFGLDTLYDGRTDTVPPAGTTPVLPPEVSQPPLYSDAPGLVPIIHTYALPVPVQIYPGQSVKMGLWITPSEVTDAILSVTGANYVIVIDDGQPQITTWGRDLATELAH